MRRYHKITLFAAAALLAAGAGAYFFNQYWIHRYDELIRTHAEVYGLSEDLVWSVIYEETYFRAWMHGADQEVGLMQVTPAVARQWGRETGLKEFERQTAENLNEFLSDPERNIQVGCWYLEHLRAKYRDLRAERAMMLAAYNAGPSRVDEWSRGTDPSTLSEDEFIARIEIASTRAYVSSIVSRVDRIRESR